MAGIVSALTRRNGEVSVIDPGILWVFLRIHGTFGGGGAVGMVVEVVVNLDIVSTQLLVVGHNIMKGNNVAAVILLAVNRVGGNSLFADDGLLHVFLLLVIAAAARTECAQQHDGIDSVSFHIV